MQERDLNRYHPGESEFTPKKPTWDTISRRMFSEESAGFAFFPDILEGRERSVLMFEQSLRALRKNLRGNDTTFAELESRGIKTLSGVMEMPLDEFSQLKKADEIRERVQTYLGDQAVLPHARLLGDVFGQPQLPVRSSRERELIDGVGEFVAILHPEEGKTKAGKRVQRILQLWYGLENCVPLSRTPEVIARAIGEEFNVIGKERVKQIHARVLRVLHHPSRSKKVKEYLTLPKRSFGRDVFGADFAGDLPPLTKDIRDADLSAAAKQEAQEKGLYSASELTPWFSLRDVARLVDLSVVDLSEETYREIADEILRVVQTETGGISQVRGEVISTQEPAKTYDTSRSAESKLVVSDFLSGVLLVTKGLSALGDRRIEDLDLSIMTYNALKRSGITRLGQIFDMGIENLLHMRGFGDKGVGELGEKLEMLLVLSGHRHEEGEIAGSFASRETLKVEKEDVILADFRKAVRSALEQGCIFSEDIQAWMVKNGRSIGFDPKGEITLALIEYAISHPQREQGK